MIEFQKSEGVMSQNREPRAAVGSAVRERSTTDSPNPKKSSEGSPSLPGISPHPALLRHPIILESPEHPRPKETRNLCDGRVPQGGIV